MIKIFESLPLGFIADNFNKKKAQKFFKPTNPLFLKLYNLSKKQILGKTSWKEPKKINAFMASAETATFMKLGGLGMIASELPECFNNTFSKNQEKMTIITPMYMGDTGKKKCFIQDGKYFGAEGVNIDITKVLSYSINFLGDKKSLEKQRRKENKSTVNNVEYLFLENQRFFSINPHASNTSAQDGCYVLNEFKIDEVERFAFFSKAIYGLLESLATTHNKHIPFPTSIVANDWHTGALSGLLKYFSTSCFDFGMISAHVYEKLFNTPVVYIIHHLGYQGWSYDNSARILNSLYEEMAVNVFKFAKVAKNTNPRYTNSLIVHDSYNQSASSIALADRIVTVSNNYQDEVSKDLSLGQDFRDVLKIRKNHRTFFGIVNGYDKKLISPNKEKIDKINTYFNSSFEFFDEKTSEKKQENKKEFASLLSKIATNKEYKNKTIPLIDAYKFEDCFKDIKNITDVPIICATSRLVEQKGYDIAATSIIKLLQEEAYKEPPIFILGGAGDDKNYKYLQDLKDEVAKFDKKAASRIFVFRGYKDEFAYAIQLVSDFYLMPCRFEPCGLTQMEAMAKGALPIAMSTGGLVDTIINGVDGFRTQAFFGTKHHVFGDNITAKRLKNNEAAYQETLQTSLKVFYEGRSILNQMTYNAMKKDFSWDVDCGSVYLYHNLLKTGHI